MEKLKNQTASSMLVTLGLIAIFSILLVGFHTAILSMTTRLDSTYSEKQTYLYSRSAVTALVEELMSLNAEYDQAWQDYQDGSGSGPRPVKDPLLKAVDGLTEQSPTLTLEDCSFGQPLIDDYDLAMDITRVMELDETGTATVAYQITATTTIDGRKDVSDTVSVVLSTEEKDFQIQEIVPGTGGGSGGGSGGSGGSFSGIYTDEPIHFGWTNAFFSGVQSGSQVVGVKPVEYFIHYAMNGGESRGVVKNIGTVKFNFQNESTVENMDFFIDGDFILFDPGHTIRFNNCNIYVTGKIEITANSGVGTATFNNCNVKCNGVSVSSMDNVLHEEGSTVVNTAANLTQANLNIPSRPKPAWAEASATTNALDFARGDGVMEAGMVYRLTTGFSLWSGIDNGMIGDATAESPITIIIGDGVQVGLNDPCGPNIRFLVEPGGTLKINLASSFTEFQADVYSERQAGKTDAVVEVQSIQTLKGTFIVPKLTYNGNNGYNYNGGGGGGAATAPEIVIETIRYNLYTNYIYVRG